ncbi:MAG: hypothetical protein M3Z85_07880, partial [Acidobacteriota bacterium]|nr:hypothetical protein [Acidobacteriota bacterium]
MPYNNPSAIEIDRKLREDFRNRLKDFGISAENTDPVLAVLFRTFAQQLDTLYSETGRIRLALLDELIGGLGIERRMARPAQTVVRFLAGSGSRIVEAGTTLTGEAQDGEKLVFATDAGIAVSSARIAFAAAYQDGALQILPGVELPEAIQAARPSLEPVRANLGINPAIFLAIENLPPAHLSMHSFFFETTPDARRIARALQSEPWCLAASSGEMGASGILRPAILNAGVRTLQWLKDGASAAANAADNELPTLPPGFYGSRLFVLPSIPAERRFACRIPRGMETALTGILGRDASQLLNTPRAWLRISFPRDIPPLRSAIGSVHLHSMTASNVECFNQTIYFAKQGTSIPISSEAGTRSYLVAPLSIFGETEAPYVPEFQFSPDPDVGRYAIRNGRIELRPAKRPDGTGDAYANLRMWVTAGARGNTVAPGRVGGFVSSSGAGGMRVANFTAAAGGTNGE